ncbi:Multidrug transporter [Tepidimonas thermarum]|uniref:Multidrug transporter n=1 Tax=Tepidimonas thermarum TaxID=335431 RepID=A0A554WVQ1_9BURK|nr:Multidrug transporter [Tepidimonas thermarum]
MGITYAVWSGLGIVLITVAAFVLYGQRIDLAGWIGIGLIVAGVLVLNVFSRATAHGCSAAPPPRPTPIVQPLFCKFPVGWS